MWLDKQKSQLKKDLAKIGPVYLCSLFFFFFAHKHLFASELRCLERKCWQDYIDVLKYVDVYELEKLTARSNEEKLI